jgi:hypothetical protein
MLHHIPDPAGQDALFARVARALKPGGVFVGVDSLPPTSPSTRCPAGSGSAPARG